MKLDLSPHAKVLIELIENVRGLSKHHKYVEARDVMRALQIVSKDFGFEIPEDMIDDMIEDIGRVRLQVLTAQLENFANFVVGLDDHLDNETLIGEQYARPSITRLRTTPK